MAGVPSVTVNRSSREPQNTHTAPRWGLWVLGLIVLVIIAAYWPAMSGQMLWDDDAHIPRPELRSLAGLYRIWFDPSSTQQYYPLLFTSFCLQHRLWGDWMLPYHLVNLLQHLAAACLVYVILRRLAIPGAILATALFALHPVQVESVAWITEQKNTLSAVFYLGALLAYLHFDVGRRWSWYVAAVALFALAVLSKTTAVTLPPALLIIFWWQRGKLSWRRDVVPLIPFFVLAAMNGLLTIWVERHVVGAEGPEFELTIWQAVLLWGRALWFYLAQLVSPVNLMFVYPRWNLDPSVWWQWLFPISMAGLIVGLWALRERYRGPLAGLLFFIVTLLPVLGFLNVFFFRFSFVSDHFQYLANLGIFVPTTAAIAIGVARLAPQQRWLGVAGCTAVVAALAMRTWQQSHNYSDQITLWRATLENNPDSPMVQYNLAHDLMAAGQMREAIEYAERAVKLAPNSPEARNNLGILLLVLGQPQEAVVHLQEAIRVRPSYAEAQNNLARALIATGRSPEAIDHLREALRLQPSFSQAYNNLGDALNATGQREEATEQFARAVQLKPDYADAHDNLGLSLFVFDRKAEAIEHFQEAVRLMPEHFKAQYHLGTALLDTGNPRESIEHFQQAVRGKPDYTKAWSNLAIAYSQTGQPREAMSAGQHALELANAQGDAALARQIEERLESFQQADHVAPQNPLTAPELPPATP